MMSFMCARDLILQILYILYIFIFYKKKKNLL